MSQFQEDNRPAQGASQSATEQSALQEYLEVLWRRKWPFLVMWIIVFGGAIAYTLKQPRIYSSGTTLVISDRSGGGGEGSDSVASSMLDKVFGMTSGLNLQTQVALLQSPDVAAAAYADPRFLTDYDRRYGFGGPTTKDKDARIMRDEEGHPVLIDGIPFIAPPPGSMAPGWAVSIAGQKDTQMITISTQAYTAQAARDLAVALRHTYLENDKKRTEEATANGLKFVASQLQDLRDQIKGAAATMVAFQRQNRTVEPNIEADHFTSHLMDLKLAVQKDHSDAEAAKYGLQYEQKVLRKLAPEETAGYVLAENPSFTLIRQDLARLTSLLIAAKEEYQPGRPEITTLESQIEADKKSLDETAQHIVTTTTKARNPLINDALGKIADNEAAWVVATEVLRLATADEAAAEKQLLTLPPKVAEYELYKAKLDELEKTYEELHAKWYELEVTENSGVANAIVASEAQKPSAPSGPNRALNIFGGLIAGLVAGLAAAVILDQFDTRVREPGAVERILNLPSLSAVPIVQADDGKAPLIGRVSQNHAFIEAFRLLRNNIYFSMPDVRSLISFENQKSHAPIIAITSATKGDGKSTIASNLAVASGLDGKRTLLIDVDLRRPAVHRVFATDRQDGLTNLVIGTSTRSEVIKQSDFPNLSILVAGPLPPLANEFLNSEACRQTLLDLAEDYDLVVLDCPPCTGLSDFQIISSVATAAVMVASLDYTRKPFLKAARQALNRSACPVLGIVLNGLSNRWSPYRNQYYYYYSYYGEDEDKDKAKRKSKVRSSTQ